MTWNFLHISDTHETTDSGSLENTKEDKYLNTYTQDYRIQPADSQRENPESLQRRTERCLGVHVRLGYNTNTPSRGEIMGQWWGQHEGSEFAFRSPGSTGFD